MPERVDLPVRRPIPDRVRPPQYMVGPKGLDNLPEQVGIRRGVSRIAAPYVASCGEITVYFLYSEHLFTI